MILASQCQVIHLIQQFGAISRSARIHLAAHHVPRFAPADHQFSTFQRRLVSTSNAPLKVPRIIPLGHTRTRSQIYCSNNGHNLKVLVYSSSDVDVVSLGLAASQGWALREIDQDVILADGRRMPCVLCGEAQLSVNKDKERSSQRTSNAAHGFDEAITLDNGSVYSKRPPCTFRIVIQTTFYTLASMTRQIS